MIITVVSLAVILLVPVCLISLYLKDHADQIRTQEKMERMLDINMNYRD